MGADESKDATPPTELTPEMQDALEANTYYPRSESKYPYFLVQVGKEGELPFGEDGIYISNCIAAYCAVTTITHLIFQTHGYNTNKKKAIKVAFADFIGGMQDDEAMPSGNDEENPFKPCFVAFTWPGVPFEFFKAKDALTRTELLVESEEEVSASGETDISRAARAARAAIENETFENDENLQRELRQLAENTVGEDQPTNEERADDEDTREDESSASMLKRAKTTPLTDVVEGVFSQFSPVLRPLENMAFSRLMKRARASGLIIGRIVARIMASGLHGPTPQRKVCTFMANSLGAQVLVGVLDVTDEMPYKPHAFFFVQGAVSRSWFATGRRYEAHAKKVAGPVVCTYSDRDFLLKNIFGPFHGDAVGFEGFPEGHFLEIKSLEELAEEPYHFENGSFNSVNCSRFINEGNFFEGGHGDFKQDETTSLYWSVIKHKLDDSAYDK